MFPDTNNSSLQQTTKTANVARAKNASEAARKHPVADSTTKKVSKTKETSIKVDNIPQLKTTAEKITAQLPSKRRKTDSDDSWDKTEGRLVPMDDSPSISWQEIVFGKENVAMITTGSVTPADDNLATINEAPKMVSANMTGGSYRSMKSAAAAINVRLAGIGGHEFYPNVNTIIGHQCNSEQNRNGKPGKVVAPIRNMSNGDKETQPKRSRTFSSASTNSVHSLVASMEPMPVTPKPPRPSTNADLTIIEQFFPNDPDKEVAMMAAREAKKAVAMSTAKAASAKQTETTNHVRAPPTNPSKLSSGRPKPLVVIDAPHAHGKRPSAGPVTIIASNRPVTAAQSGEAALQTKSRDNTRITSMVPLNHAQGVGKGVSLEGELKREGDRRTPYVTLVMTTDGITTSRSTRFRMRKSIFMELCKGRAANAMLSQLVQMDPDIKGCKDRI